MHPVIFTRLAREESIDVQDWYENEAQAWADVFEQRLTPRSSAWKLRELFNKRLMKANGDPQNARSALFIIFSEQDSWSDYVDGYADRTKRYIWQLGTATTLLLLLSMTALYLARYFSPLLWLGLLFAGGAGSSISAMVKLPALDASLAGELDAYERQNFGGTVIGAVASLVGCAFLGWGIFPVAIQNQTFTDALNACTALPSLSGATAKILIVFGVAVILGFSERTLTSLERRLLGHLRSEKVRRFPAPRVSSRKG